MVEIHGKPFLAYQIEQLRDQGFKKILLLLGYLPEVVQEYFGNGSRWGIKIEYSISAIEDETARRLKLAEFLLDPYFLLLYCDNYWPMQIDKMWPRFVASGAPAMITVYTNKDGYTRNSVRVGADGYVAVYDKTCASPGLCKASKSVTLLSTNRSSNLLPEAMSLWKRRCIRRLAQQRQLLAYVTDHRYYSVGALHRLPLTETFFEPHDPTVILDRDGVLNKKPPTSPVCPELERVRMAPGSERSIATAQGSRIPGDRCLEPGRHRPWGDDGRGPAADSREDESGNG